jgi:pimeloyl-ACP methyl ester carboxylesterase
MLFAIAFVALPLQAAVADEVVTDYKGNKIRLQEGEVDNNGIKLHYYTVGEGPLVFLSHGNGDFWFGWRHQLAFLAQRYKVVVYDLRNFNRSSKIPGPENNRQHHFVSDLLAVQNHFTKDPAIHIGTDQGGMIAWSYAMLHPEKVKLLIEVNAIHPRAFIRELAISPEQRKNSTYIHTMIEDPYGKGMEWERRVMSLERQKNEPEEIRKLWTEALARTGEEGLKGTVDWYRTNFPAPPFTMESKGFDMHFAEFPHIKAPTLAIMAQNSGALLPAGYNDLATWIDAPFTMVAYLDGVHFEAAASPERFNRTIGNWLDFWDPMPKKLLP